MDRVALVAICWFAFWIVAGVVLGRYLEMPGFGGIYGFIFALVTGFAWPRGSPHRPPAWMDS
jgi:hypothetical protein